MKKYILLGFPVVFYCRVILEYVHNHFFFTVSLQLILNMVFVTGGLFFLLKRTRFQNVLDWFIGACFSIYFLILYHNTIEFMITFQTMHDSFERIKYIVNSVNLVPVKGIINLLRYNPSAMYQIIGNAFMLTPFAFAMRYFKWASTNKQAILYSFLCTLGIELIQFLQTMLALAFDLGIRRSADIDDVILNTIGAVVGVGIYIIWAKIGYLFNRQREIMKQHRNIS